MSALPQPKGRQREVLALSHKGHHVVLGTAGSGKTVMAIYRALYLASPGTDHHGRTLLVTFNRCLVAYLESLAKSIPRDEVDIRNYHRFARGYLNSIGRMRNNCICGPEQMSELCSRAVAQVKSTGTVAAVLDRPTEVLVEELKWLEQHGIMSSEEYVNAERVNRAGTRIVRADRPIVFNVYERYRNLRSMAGWDYDWHDLSHAVVAELGTDSRDRQYRHIVIDEGQDLSPMELRSLADAVPSDGSLTFFGDMAQQIYGNRLSWRNAGLKVAKIWKFEENYRNSRQVAQLALALAKMPSFPDDADLVSPKEPIANGPLPALVSFSTATEEDRFVADFARNLGKVNTVAVLFRDRDQANEFRSCLGGKGTRLHRELRRWPSGAGIYHGTYHSAKGLEFDAVILPHLSKNQLPYPRDVETFGEPDAESRNSRLLYVGITRARSTLVLTHTGQTTPLLPGDSALYKKEHR